jgi:hypothetical protein
VLVQPIASSCLRNRHTRARPAAVVLALLALARPAAAQDAGRIRQVAAVTPASGGQPVLAVGFDASGTLRAAVCPATPCRQEKGQSLALPAAAQALATSAVLSVVRIGQRRHAVHVKIAEPRARRSWEAVVFARPGATQPEVLFSGWTGLLQGELGERRGPMLLVSDALPDGTRRIVIGEQREELTLCGRPAVIAPQLLLAADLKLHPAKVQRLSAEERAQAHRITAQRLPEVAAAASAPVLRAVAASSAVGQPKSLTDGDPNTTWAENRGREGRGEFVLMQAPPQLPIEGFEVAIRPPEAEPEQGVSPKVFYLVTDSRVFHVELPEDAWEHPGARYLVQLDQPVQTSCVALVTESAYRVTKTARVTFAELHARTAFGSSSPEELVEALGPGGARAEAAGAALRSVGEEGFVAVAEAFDRLGEQARSVALDVIDHAPCAVSSPVYVRALLSEYEAHRVHASSRLRRCGPHAAGALVEALPRAATKRLPLLADELALIAPDRAVEVIVPLLGSSSSERRRELRVVLARASDAPRARAAVFAALGDRSLSEVARIDLLRALGPRVIRFRPAASQAFARLATSHASFRTRYLLLEPAAALAVGDPSALAYLRRALVADRSAYIRAQAAWVVSDPALLPDELLRALHDQNVRVREAALGTLATPRAQFAAPAITERLSRDPWPLVRAAAADALAELGSVQGPDRALYEALDDDSPHVRSPVLRALGRRGARAYAEAVRERLTDADEPYEVRIAAAQALGLMCDTEAVGVLTDYALLLAEPMGAGPDRVLAPTALRALARLNPPDLPKRLAPLQSKKAPTLTRQAARAALGRRGGCRP